MTFFRAHQAITKDKPLLIVVAGPTGVGKTSVAIRLATHYQTEVISADSRQFYRELKIGVAVPSEEQLKQAPHHFIGHLSVTEDYNVYRYEKDALQLLTHLFAGYDNVVMTGGSGLYLNAVCYGIDELPDQDPGIRSNLQELYAQEGILPLQEKLAELDPEYFNAVDKNNPKRLLRALEVCIQSGRKYSELRSNKPKKREFKTVMIGLELPRDVLNDHIDARVDRMIEEGLVEEVRSLFKYRHLNSLNTVGYKEIFEYLDNRITLDKAIANIKKNTRKYAKRQMTWFRKDHNIRWFNPDDTDGMMALINSL